MLKWLIAVMMALAGVPVLVAQSTARNPHGNIALACQNCHTTTSWVPLRAKPEFEHNRDTKYPLRGQHATVSCNACHVSKVFSEAGTQCAECHADLHRRQFGAQCENCHTVQGWQLTNRSTQSHMNRFPLLGAHATATCDNCHKGAAVGTFVGLSTACISCHASDYAGANSPPHAASGFSQNCSQCHLSMTTWTAANFNHASTGFPLTGAHTTVQCTLCHVNNNYALTSGACYPCHVADYNSAGNPPHAAARFSQDCSQCHTTASWATATFNHSATGFPLTGAHATVQCTLCHINNNYALTSGACYPCHVADYNSARNPPHAASGFPQDCSQCHTTANWTSATFNHASTGFPLTGAHSTVQCALCHVNNNYALTSGACYPCHVADYNGTNNPPHAAAKFGQDCSQCHSTTNWDGATFNHATTGFALTGAHATVQCTLCHVNNSFALTSGACYPCHVADYNSANNPPHAASGFPQDCSQCHSTVNWTSATFNHAATGFPLTGAHATVQCALCHVNNNYALTSGACYPCHVTDYNGTNNPPHAAAKFGQDCSQCHSTTNWDGATFNHATTGFALTGAHATVQCALCHVNNNYALTSGACYPCHVADYNATNNPPHAASGFPQDCSLCHSTTNWTSATFNHAATGFTLTGAHLTITCAQCHVNNNYSLTSGACYPCHTTDYNGTNNPPHAASGFPQDCSLCHSTTNWNGATFNHATTGFTLTGAHATLQCAQCHVNNNYNITSAACFNCHAADYNGTTNPNHAAAGFPKTCDTCHNFNSWAGAVFNHTYFPTNHGGANGVCATCHTNANDYSVFQCTNCHSSAATTPRHSGVRGYVYNSTNCYACHPKGSS